MRGIDFLPNISSSYSLGVGGRHQNGGEKSNSKDLSESSHDDVCTSRAERIKSKM